MAPKKIIKDEWVLDKTIDEFISDEVSLSATRARKLCQLFDDGCEVAYIARYRGDVHGGISCEDVRHTYQAYIQGQELNKKATKAIANVRTNIQDSKEMKNVVDIIKKCEDGSEISDIVKMYSKGARKTKASIAKEMGFEEIAKNIINGQRVHLKNDKQSHEHLVISIADVLNKMEATIKAVNSISKLETRIQISVKSSLSSKAKKSANEPNVKKSIEHFKDYVDFSKPAFRVPDYQILALDRAEEQEVIKWSIDIDKDELKRHHPYNSIRVDKSALSIFLEAVDYSITKLFLPKIQRATKKYLQEKAEKSAIRCFSTNLEQLFSREPLRNVHVISLDPGYINCKSAFLKPNGEIIETATFSYYNRAFDRKGVELLKRWSNSLKNTRLVFAIGDGKGSYDTQLEVAKLIDSRQLNQTLDDISFCVVSEVGASKYSITDVAKQEMPDIEITERSAVSIGRRLIDPMGEYVKIEPQHLGMGMYQLSVNVNKLAEALKLVVREKVSLRGVDVNCSSEHLLKQVCGLTSKTAAGIISYRKKNGTIKTRDELLKVAGIGKATFVQCAGFLTVNHVPVDDEPPRKKPKTDWNPLDATVVHPDQYDIARRVLSKCSLSLDDVTNSSKLRANLSRACEWSEDEKCVVDLLLTEPHLIPPPALMKTVRSMISLRVGETVQGTCANQTDFGIFVDIGIERNGLIHSRALRKPWPEVGTHMQVRITQIELERQRVSLEPV